VKVLLDTNVLVSAFATRGLCADVLRSVLAEHELILCEAVLKELKRVLIRRILLPQTQVDDILGFLGDYPIEPTPRPLPPLSVRDPDDIKVLAAALAAEVDVLVTGDHDLLTVEGDHPLRIVSPRGFWEMVKAAADHR